MDLRTGHIRDVRAWPEAGYGYPPAEMKYRWHWNYPMTISRHNHNKVYIGSQYVHVTTNEGQTWTVISPDLTTNDKSHQQSSGGVSTDNLFTFDGCTLYAMAESPVKEGVLWTGSNDGLVQVTQDDGKHWDNVSANIPGLPKWSTIRSIDASGFDAGTVYISVDAQFIGDFSPYIYKTTDFGKTWTSITGNLPVSNSSFVHQIKEDPGKKGALWAGTDNGLYFSPDDGTHWIHIRNNLPPVPIYGITIQPNFKDLVLGTYGRGFYILDDITPFRDFSTEVQQSEAWLFPPRKAYRFRPVESIHAERSSSSGENPPYGASINYYEKDTVRGDTVKILVLDGKGATVQQIKASNKQGINRVWWDLGLQPYILPALRTRPEDEDWVKLDSTGVRAMTIFDLDIGPGLPTTKVLPGTYTIVLRIGKKEWKQPIQVLRDPNTVGSDEDIQKQYDFGVKIYGSIQNLLHMIDTLEILRSKVLAAAGNPSLNKKEKAKLLVWQNTLYKVENLLHDTHQTGAREDIFRSPAQLLERFLTISKESISGGSDFRPTDQHQQVYDLLSGRLVNARAKYEEALKEIPLLKAGTPLPGDKMHPMKNN
jgi:hypothetical protein